MRENKNLRELLELANRYPSPHNGQPLRLKELGDSGFEILFDRQRGLRSSDISYIFSFVSIGVFIEHLSLCAEALGHDFSCTLALPDEADLRGEGLVKVASCKFHFNKRKPDDKLAVVLRERRTSRKKYSEAPGGQTAAALFECARKNDMRLEKLDKEQARQAIWLNQRAVFDDMFDEPVRKELDHWLRYTKQEKETKRDGLSYDCLELNGKLMKWMVDHPRLLRAPVLSWLIKHYYLRTMTDNSDVFYMLAPFATEKEAYRVGEVLMRLWMIIARSGDFLHPLGTIMSNQDAHQDFLKLAGVTDESRDRSYLVFIFRAGKSPAPNRSLRLPVNEHLLVEEA